MISIILFLGFVHFNYVADLMSDVNYLRPLGKSDHFVLAFSP